MSVFCVFYMTAMDDLPIGIYPTRKKAERVAASLSPDNCPLANESASLMVREFSITTGVAIAEFRDCRMAKWDVVRMFDDEEPAE